MLGLTRRESDILREMAAGKTNLRIADNLYISEGTVKSHVKSVLRKLGGRGLPVLPGRPPTARPLSNAILPGDHW